MLNKRLNLVEKRYKANQIIKLVNEYFNVECNVHARKRTVMIPRQIAIYFIHKNIFMSTVEIGNLFVSRTNKYLDHASVLHSKNVIIDFLTCDKQIIKFVNDLSEDVKLLSELSGDALLIFKEKTEILEIIKRYDLEDIKNLKTELKNKKHEKSDKTEATSNLVSL